ncbi:Rv3235 family protein [Nocardioides yefusunii]|uniref:Rv3235 family protein n=1 Tax=Nocardioides yefusunii TaxID=2500546 RepID=A0ABW1R0T5_9ACTN|nr:Rv3235 family protein [Nocardioides yefusunii]
MSAMTWTANAHHPDTARTHRTRPTTVASTLRRIEGNPAPQRPVCDLVAIDPRRRRSVHQWVDRYARTVLEIISGERPATQVTRWTTVAVQHDLTRRAHLVARASSIGASAPAPASTGDHPGVPRATVRSVHVSFLDQHTVEASVHVRQGQQSRAFAARFEWRRERWVCTALDFC